MIVVQALLMLGVRASEIRIHPLDERSVYTIRLSREEPTTCVFPTPLKAIVGANVSQRLEDNPGILLSHEVGTEYFSLRLLKDGAAGALNVMLRGKVYALAFVPAAEPDRAVVFIDEPPVGREPPLTAEALRGLVERAKQVEREEGRATSGRAFALEHARPGNVTHYRAFTATVEWIVRFEPEDALVFRIRLENALAVPVPYNPEGLAIQFGREFFPAAYAEASGAIPPRGSGLIYVVIAGAPDGGRANLSVQENYSVIVPHP